MSRKDYVAIASAIRSVADSTALHLSDALVLTAERIADKLQADNPRFDRVKFLTACGF